MVLSSWRSVLSAAALALAFLWTSAACGATDVRRGPAPAWVEVLPVPKENPNRASQATQGLYHLLIDHQQWSDPRSDIDYRRSIYRITERSGLERGAAFNIDVAAAGQTATLHHIWIWRDGVRLDRTASASIRMLQRESKIDEGILTGTRTAHIQIEDVHVGDVVDYAYSWETRDPLMAGLMTAAQSMGWSDPVALTRFRLLWPAGAPITVKRFAGAGPPTVKRVAGRDIYEWRAEDPEPIPGEKDAPGWLDQWPRVEASNLTSWAGVAEWAVPLYATTEPLPPAWEAEVKRIATASSDPYARVTAALRLVQDRVRYVSLSIGEGGFRPRSPTAVVESGYGDCKDKARLLTLILRRLGIKAVPALVDTEAGRRLPESAPSVYAFNHAVVKVIVGGKDYWVDPTRSQEGGRFPHLAAVDYGWALPIAHGQTRLEALPKRTAAQPTMTVVERYALDRPQTPTLKLEVLTTYRGGEADWFRGEFASRSTTEVGNQYLAFYAKKYPGLRADRPIAVSDDRDANIITIREAYTLPHDRLGDLLAAFPIEASSLTDYAEPPGGERTRPLWLPSAVNKRHSIVLVTPNRRPPAPAKVEVDGKAFRFTLTPRRDGDMLTLDYALVGRADLMRAEQVEDYRGEQRRLSDSTWWNLDLTSNAGGTIGEDPAWVTTLYNVAGAGAVIVALIIAALWGGRADAAYAAEGRYYPVNLRKFLVMSVATVGVYLLYWFWKSWRWARTHGGEQISPFWRTAFGGFFLYPLFERANRGLGVRRLPVALGAIGAIGYVLFGAAENLSARLPEPPPALSFIFLATISCTLPTAVAVLRLNEDAGHVVERNSRFTIHSWVAIGFGLVMLGLVVFGAFA